MFGRNKKAKAQAAAETSGDQQPQGAQPQAQAPAPPMGGFVQSELQVFDGKGHPAVMVFYTDKNGVVHQKLRKGRDFHANLPHVRRR
jgi:hypothetical protein